MTIGLAALALVLGLAAPASATADSGVAYQSALPGGTPSQGVTATSECQEVTSISVLSASTDLDAGNAIVWYVDVETCELGVGGVPVAPGTGVAFVVERPFYKLAL